jgi:hypothetical protein
MGVRVYHEVDARRTTQYVNENKLSSIPDETVNR